MWNWTLGLSVVITLEWNLNCHQSLMKLIYLLQENNSDKQATTKCDENIAVEI